MDIQRFKELPLMGILRGIDKERLEPLVEAIISAGLVTVEITMNTDGAPQLLRQMNDRAGDRLMIGAGTVLTMSDLKQALDSGATFIVLPTVVDDVVHYCVKNKIPVFPGALTPQEIYCAWQAGATMVKVFPAKFLGPHYFAEIKGPFRDIELLACGGVRNDTIASYFACGASGVAFGASIFKKELIEAGSFSSIAEAIRSLIDHYVT